MFVKCPECKQHYDDTSNTDDCSGPNTPGHYMMGTRPVDERIATRAVTESLAKRAMAGAGTA